MRKRTSFVILIGSLWIVVDLAGCGTGGEPSITAKAESDKVAMASADDAAMLRAFAKAKGSLDAFLARVAAKDPLVQEPLVKIKVQDGEAVEYFWIGSFSQESGWLNGTVTNDPEVVHNIYNGQTISFPRSQIFDWTYTDAQSGQMIGNYTACALLTMRSQAMRRSFGGPTAWIVTLKRSGESA
jgi:uncharacterized protein YegJ (DUF2314 family)